MLRKEFLARIMDRIGQNALDDFPSHKLDGSVSSLVELNRFIACAAARHAGEEINISRTVTNCKVSTFQSICMYLLGGTINILKKILVFLY